MKVIIGFIMIVIGFLGGFASGIYSIYLKFSNPDMTSTRILIEYPQPLIYLIFAGIIFYIGYKIANNK
jgi:di/tricarboxylate transporter